MDSGEEAELIMCEQRDENSSISREKRREVLSVS